MKYKLFNHVKFLSEGIGPRLPASDGERRASNYIISQIESWDLHPLVEKFKTPKLIYDIFQFLFLTGFLICLFFFHFHIYFQFFLILIEIFLIYFFYSEMTFSRTPFFKIFQRHYSKNIYVKIPAKKEVKERIIITAHKDSSTSSVFFYKRFIKYLPIGLRLSFFMFNALLLCSMFYFIFPSVILSCIFFIMGLFFLFSFILSFHAQYIASPSHGANDNASGVAVLLALAEQLASHSLINKEIYLVFTGAEEAGNVGIYEFIKKHNKKFAGNAVFIALDCAGIGIPTAVRSEGMLKTFKSDEKILRLLQESSKDTGIPIQIKDFPLGYTEMEVPYHFKYPSVTIGAVPEDPETVPHWHQNSDTIGYIQSDTLERTYRLLLDVIQKGNRA